MIYGIDRHSSSDSGKKGRQRGWSKTIIWSRKWSGRDGWGKSNNGAECRNCTRSGVSERSKLELLKRMFSR